MSALSRPPDSGSPLGRKWQWHLLKFARLLWVRASLYALAGVLTALVAVAVRPYLPEGIGANFGVDSVDDILKIIATSMLTVTTFSLGIMHAAFAGAASNVTPRASRLLMDDTTIQNSLATFLGTFLFSIVGIVSLKAGIYGEEGRLVLFAVTIAVILVIVATFIRWIEILRRFGRIGDTVARVERAAAQSLETRMDCPCLGARPRTGPPPPQALSVAAGETGYVEHVDLQFLSDHAEEHGVEIHLDALPGAFVHASAPLAWVAPPTGEGAGERDPEDEGAAETHARIRRAFSVNDHRTFDQDPRFGLTVLAEIASRALSPAVNDPGTAIDIIGRGVRLLSAWAGRSGEISDGGGGSGGGEREFPHPRLHVEPLLVKDFFEDFFRPIARDGASLVEVQIRLQKALLVFAQCESAEFRDAASEQSAQALERAETALSIEADRAVVRELAERVRREAESAPGRNPRNSREPRMH